VVWPQNHSDGFLWFGIKTGGDEFSGLDLKIDSYNLVIWHQNHCDGFLVWASKPSWLRVVGCAIKLTEGGRRETRVKI
jgi:hypothetical protein